MYSPSSLGEGGAGGVGGVHEHPFKNRSCPWQHTDLSRGGTDADLKGAHAKDLVK